MNCTVDANVFVAAVRLEEKHYTVSRGFLHRARAEAVTVFCPTLILPECAAAIARPTGDAAHWPKNSPCLSKVSPTCVW